MAHSTEIVAWKKLNNGQHSICIRCCGNEDTDHWHTMNVMAPDDQGIMRPVDKEKRDANIEAAKQFVATQHNEMQAHTEEMLDHAGAVTEHA